MIKHIPNSITCCNLLSGCISIVLICNGYAVAAGAMIYVVCEELIPEKEGKDKCHRKTIGVMLGFTIMMILDVALG